MAISRPKVSPRRLVPLFSFFGRLLFLLTLAFFLVFLHQRYLRVNRLICRLGENPCPEALVNQLSAYLGRSFLTLPRPRLTADLTSTGLVSSTKLKLSPGSLEVILQPAVDAMFLRAVFTPVAPSLSFFSETSTTSAPLLLPEINAYLATLSGQNFALSRNGNLNPAASAPETYLIAESLPNRESLLNLYAWLQSLKQFNFENLQVFVFGQNVIASAKDRPLLLFSLGKNSETSLNFLPGLFNLEAINATKLLDFRFNHPILR